jgi:hypothetical protein
MEISEVNGQYVSAVVRLPAREFTIEGIAESEGVGPWGWQVKIVTAADEIFYALPEDVEVIDLRASVPRPADTPKPPRYVTATDAAGMYWGVIDTAMHYWVRWGISQGEANLITRAANREEQDQ